jgi:hypothetical protein
MVHFSNALSSFLINPRRSSYFCVVGTVKIGFSSSEEADKGSVKLLLLLLFNTLLLLLSLMLFFLSSTHPFNGLESSVTDKPNVPATIPPIKKGKFSDMTSKMSSFSLLLLLLFEDAIRPKVVLVNTGRCDVCLFLSRTFAPLPEEDDEKEEEEEEEEDVVANVVVIVRAVSIVFSVANFVDVHLSEIPPGAETIGETRGRYFCTRTYVRRPFNQRSEQEKEYFSREQKKGINFFESSEFCLRKTARARFYV